MSASDGSGAIFVFKDPVAGEDDNPVAITSDTSWREYCERRERVERAAAKRTSSTKARLVHQELAQAYARLARQMEGE